MVSQPLHYMLQHTAVGTASTFSIYGALMLRGDIQDEMGFGALIFTVFGGGIGFISGTTYGVYRGYVEQVKEPSASTVVHPRPLYGFSFITEGNLVDGTGAGFSESISLTARQEDPSRCLPDVYALSFTMSDKRMALYASETKVGLSGTYFYPSPPSIFSLFYGISGGMVWGHYWDPGPDPYEKRTILPYANVYGGAELNLFDFVNGALFFTFEPLNPHWFEQGRRTKLSNMFSIGVNAGASIY